MADHVDQDIGNYHLISWLGEGSFADVYLAEHRRRKTQAAVKVWKIRLTMNIVRSFLNEVRVSILLKHPHIVPIQDFGVLSDNTPYLVMDYAPNGSLRQHHPRGTQLPLGTIVTYVKQVAEALQYIHDEELVHRDVKPDNMLLGEHGEVLLSDFGIVTVSQTLDPRITQSGIGTIEYMAPEQILARPSRASDQYALGVVVYEWLCGFPPFENEGNIFEVAEKHKSVLPLPLHDKLPTISPQVEQVVMKALGKDPRERFASVQEFAKALEQAYLLDLDSDIALKERRQSFGISFEEGTEAVRPQAAHKLLTIVKNVLKTQQAQAHRLHTSSLLNMAIREIRLKIVYYGIHGCGKTENLHYIHQILNQDVGDMVSVKMGTEDMLYFDLFLFELKLHGFGLRFALWTVPGDMLYSQTRISTLKGASAVVFVADSQSSKLQENIESWNELQELLRRENKNIAEFPLVMQWNKRNLQDIHPVSVLEQYFNPYQVPSFEAVAETGEGVIECLGTVMGLIVSALERA